MKTRASEKHDVGMETGWPGKDGFPAPSRADEPWKELSQTDHRHCHPPAVGWSRVLTSQSPHQSNGDTTDSSQEEVVTTRLVCGKQPL